MPMFKHVARWAHGLMAALVGGSAGAISSGFGSIAVAPDKFNLNAGLSNTFKLMGIVALINGVVTAAAYLKQAPLPPSADEDTTTFSNK